MQPASAKVRHIVVAMMGGRSFDHMLGGLRAVDPRIDGLTGKETNPDSTGRLARVRPQAAYQGQLSPSPNHSFAGVDLQLFGDSATDSRTPTMQGFVKSYFEQRREVKHSHRVMHYFNPAKLPVLTTLATEFAVFNRWFSSVPGPTLCNRAFAHYGTSFGHVGMELRYSNQKYPSIYERMLAKGRTAKMYDYFDQASSTLEIVNLLQHQAEFFGTFQEFLTDCKGGTLPDYCFIEPNYSDHDGPGGSQLIASDQRPDHHVLEGERFIARVYNALRANPALWSSTALLLVYDDHGGIYDHVAPPACTQDEFEASATATGTGTSFKFDRLGVRVPAVLISPWIPRGTVVDGRVFEHASIPATVTEFFVGEYGDRSPREKNADTFLDLLSLAEPRTDAPVFSLGDDADVAVQSLGVDADQAPAGAPVIQIQPLTPTIAGYRSDVAAGADLLNITPEVEALCSVLAAKDVEPPVSVGLFGDWGSGKTFFMRQMENEFNRIKEETRNANGRSAYCSEIVQLWFNAWHYIDKNIWASLAAEIFDGLAEAVAFEASGADERSAIHYERAQLSAQAATVKQELDAAVRHEGETAIKLRTQEERIARFESQTRQLVDTRGYLKALLRGALGFAVAETQVRDEIEQVRKKLDTKLEDAAAAMHVPSDKANTLAFKTKLLELRGLAGRARALVMAVAYSKHRLAWAIYLAATVMAVAAVVLIRPFTGSISNGVVSWAVAMSGVIVPLLNFVPRLNRAFKMIEEARDESARTIETQQKKELDALNADHKSAVQEVETGRAETEKKRAALKSLEDQIEALRADRQLADFIQRRRESSDYKKHLGVIAQAYADFEQLSTLLAKVKDELDASPADAAAVQSGAKTKLLPRIDRIVLYIDDLDRCPEDTVVAVLQAIHLLLFFPLFVVIVGVDSRWLLHSLKQQSPAFRRTPEGDGFEAGEWAHWESTPLNYLEKIFQIPFAVRPLQLDGFENLLNDLTAPHESATIVTKPSDASRTGGDSASTKSTAAGDDQPSTSADAARQSADFAPPAAQQPKVKPKPFDLNPDYLRLDPGEREFMKLMHPLIPSPRAAKRFVNVYRLLRTTVEANEKAAFVTDRNEGEYRAVQLLLAIQTGYPDQAMTITRDLIEQRPTGSWWKFIDAYGKARIRSGQQPARASSKSSTEAAAASAEKGDRLEPQRWLDFVERLNSLRPSMTFDSCNDFVKWAPRVARYSFQSARVLQFASARPEKHSSK